MTDPAFTIALLVKNRLIGRPRQTSRGSDSIHRFQVHVKRQHLTQKQTVGQPRTTSRRCIEPLQTQPGFDFFQGCPFAAAATIGQTLHESLILRDVIILADLKTFPAFDGSQYEAVSVGRF
jgi:hypothetical protein